MKIVFLDQNSIQAQHEKLDYSSLSLLGDLQLFQHTSHSQVIERSAGADVLITVKNQLLEEHLKAIPSLKLVCKAGTGVGNIDVDAATRNGITVCNLPGYGSYIVAQWTWSLMCALAGNIFAYNRELKSGTNWSGLSFMYPITELRNKTLGLIGYGGISKQVASFAQAFGMSVLFYSRFPDARAGYPFVSLETIAHESDFISVHSNLTEYTKALINKQFLSMVKPTCYLINTARAAIIEEKALIGSLEEKRIAGAALDVFWEEPIPRTHPLLEMDNVLLTPHMAWGSLETRQNMLNLLSAVISRFFKGEAVTAVNSPYEFSP